MLGRLSAFGFVNQQSMFLDGVDGHVTLGTTADVQFDGTTPFSLSCWVKHVGGSFQAILNNVDAGPNFPGVVLVASLGGRVGFGIVSEEGVDFMARVANQSFPIDTWAHVVVTYNGVDRAGMNAYLDGAPTTVFSLQGSPTLAGSAFSAATWRIGAPGGPSNGFLHGNIDEVSFHGFEMTPAQVQTLYNDGKPLYVPSYVPTLHYYRMGDRVSDFPTVPDMIAGLDGTAVNLLLTDIVEDVP